MSNFRKTLPVPPPGKTIDEALEAGLRSPAVRKSAGDRARTGEPRLSKSSSGGDFRRSSRHGRRSLPPPTVADPPAREDARNVGWAAQARSLETAIEEALRSGTPSDKVLAAIGRAYGAWHLDGSSTRHIARAAHLSRRAYDAIRGTGRSGLEAAYVDCARVLHLGLPSAMRRRVSIEVVTEAVRAMRREADRWVAVVDATMLIAGWTDANRARASEAVRQALDEHSPEASSED